MKRDLGKPLAPTYGDDPKKKKYTAKDSTNYEGMMDRQFNDAMTLGKNIGKGGMPTTRGHVINARMSLRNDSIEKNAYGKRFSSKKK